jgi:hypothetical protein
VVNNNNNLFVRSFARSFVHLFRLPASLLSLGASRNDVSKGTNRLSGRANFFFALFFSCY